MTCFPSNPIIEAAAKEGICIISFRHERGAVMPADGISRANARPKVWDGGHSITSRC